MVVSEKNVTNLIDLMNGFLIREVLYSPQTVNMYEIKNINDRNPIELTKTLAGLVSYVEYVRSAIILHSPCETKSDIGIERIAAVINNGFCSILFFIQDLLTLSVSAEVAMTDVVRQQQQQQQQQHVGVATVLDNLPLSNCVVNAFILCPW